MSAADFKINDASLSSHSPVYGVTAELVLARGTLPVSRTSGKEAQRHRWPGLAESTDRDHGEEVHERAA